MKGINDSPVPRACSDRQVLLYPTGWEEPPPGAMEEIKISIVNDRAGGTKRERDEDPTVTSCVKRSRHAVFSCSTPIAARTWAIKSKLAKNHPHSPTWHPQGENAEQGDEWDDSLLEPSDNEDDSELCLTLDEIETLLDDDDDDSCYAAEPLQKFSEVTTCVVTFTPSESEHEGENGGDSPCITLDVSEALTKDLESEGDICNYAAMPPSPCLSAIDTVEVAIPIQSSVCNVKSPPKFLTAKTAIDSDLPTPLSGIKEVSTSLLPDSPTPELPLPPSILSGVDDEVEFIEDPDLAFDCDIDNLLAISPGDASSVGDASYVEDDNSVRLATITTKGNSLSVVSDSTLPPQDSEPDQILTAHAACSSTADVAQDLNTPGMPKGHHHPPAESEPLKEALPSTTSYVVSTEQKIFTDSPVTDQNVESQKLPEGETKGMPNDESASRPTDPTESAAPRANVRSKIVASFTFKATSFPGPGKEKPRIAVAALPRPSFRDVLSECELETMKNIYFNKVLMHVDSQEECNLEDPLYELASLQNQIGRENQNWQHPSDYTKRNHPRVGRKPFKRCSLHQWVTQNGGPTERFTSIPATFKRSPIPGALPFSS